MLFLLTFNNRLVDLVGSYKFAVSHALSVETVASYIRHAGIHGRKVNTKTFNPLLMLRLTTATYNPSTVTAN